MNSERDHNGEFPAISEDLKAKFYEIILTENDYCKAKIDLDLAGYPMTEDLDFWLKTYYEFIKDFDKSKRGMFPIPILDK